MVHARTKRFLTSKDHGDADSKGRERPSRRHYSTSCSHAIAQTVCRCRLLSSRSSAVRGGARPGERDALPSQNKLFLISSFQLELATGMPGAEAVERAAQAHIGTVREKTKRLAAMQRTLDLQAPSARLVLGELLAHTSTLVRERGSSVTGSAGAAVALEVDRHGELCVATNVRFFDAESLCAYCASKGYSHGGVAAGRRESTDRPAAGAGFDAVFRLSDAPIVACDDLCFSFDLSAGGLLGHVNPTWQDPARIRASRASLVREARNQSPATLIVCPLKRALVARAEDEGWGWGAARGAEDLLGFWRLAVFDLLLASGGDIRALSVAQEVPTECGHKTQQILSSSVDVEILATRQDVPHAGRALETGLHRMQLLRVTSQRQTDASEAVKNEEHGDFWIVQGQTSLGNDGARPLPRIVLAFAVCEQAVAAFSAAGVISAWDACLRPLDENVWGCAGKEQGHAFLVQAEWQLLRTGQAGGGVEEFWGQEWNREMVRAVSRVFVAAVEANPWLRLHTGRFLRAPDAPVLPPPCDGCGTGGSKLAPFEESEWRWTGRGIYSGPLRDAMLAGLRESSSVIAIAGGGNSKTCACREAVLRPVDLGSELLSDDEAFEALGVHFVAATQAAELDTSTQAALGLRYLTAVEVVTALRRLQDKHGRRSRGAQWLARGGAVLDRLFAYLWRQREPLGLLTDLGGGSEWEEEERKDEGKREGGSTLSDLRALCMLPLIQLRPPIPSRIRNGGESERSGMEDFGGELEVVVGSVYDYKRKYDEDGSEGMVYAGAATEWVARAGHASGALRVLAAKSLCATILPAGASGGSGEEWRPAGLASWCGCLSPLCPTCLAGCQASGSIEQEKGQEVWGEWSTDALQLLQRIGVCLEAASVLHLEQGLSSLPGAWLRRSPHRTPAPSKTEQQRWWWGARLLRLVLFAHDGGDNDGGSIKQAEHGGEFEARGGQCDASDATPGNLKADSSSPPVPHVRSFLGIVCSHCPPGEAAGCRRMQGHLQQFLRADTREVQKEMGLGRLEEWLWEVTELQWGARSHVTQCMRRHWWTAVCRRDAGECAICLSHLHASAGDGAEDAVIMIKTCSHLLHKECLRGYLQNQVAILKREEENRQRNRVARAAREDVSAYAKCPTCRSCIARERSSHIGDQSAGHTKCFSWEYLDADLVEVCASDREHTRDRMLVPLALAHKISSPGLAAALTRIAGSVAGEDGPGESDGLDQVVGLWSARGLRMVEEAVQTYMRESFSMHLVAQLLA